MGAKKGEVTYKDSVEHSLLKHPLSAAKDGGGMSHFHTSKDGANRKAPCVKLDKLAKVRKTRERESDSSTPPPFIGG